LRESSSSPELSLASWRGFFVREAEMALLAGAALAGLGTTHGRRHHHIRPANCGAICTRRNKMAAAKMTANANATTSTP
jgi:hypothetical protein